MPSYIESIIAPQRAAALAAAIDPSNDGCVPPADARSVSPADLRFY